MLNTPHQIANTFVEAIRAQVLSELKTAEPTPVPTVTPRLLTVQQAAQYIGRSDQAVRHLIFQRDLPTIRCGRNVRLDLRDLDHWIENHRS